MDAFGLTFLGRETRRGTTGVWNVKKKNNKTISDGLDEFDNRLFTVNITMHRKEAAENKAQVRFICILRLWHSHRLLLRGVGLFFHS